MIISVINNVLNIFVSSSSRTTDETRIGGGITYSTNPANSSLSTAAEMDTVLSGMFSFHIPSGTWQNICDDLGVPFLSGQRNSPIIRARVGHSMLFHHVSIAAI